MAHKAALAYKPRRDWQQEYENWRALVGVRGLTAQQLKTWCRDPKRKLECVFCGNELAIDARYCPKCKEYKGLQPYIPGWSEE